MSRPARGHFAPQDDVPDVEPFRRYYAEGGFVEPAEEYAGGGSVRRWLKTLADVRKQPLGVTVSEEVLPDIFDDMRFKTLFETNQSSGAANKPWRADTEFELFGTPRSLDPAKRPVYGHVFNPNSYSGDVDQYGNWTAALNSAVKDRATVTWGDSLGHGADAGIGPFRYTDDIRSTFEALDESPEFGRTLLRHLSNQKIEPPTSFSEYATSPWFPRYLEAQIHGGVTLEDVNALVARNVLNKKGVDQMVEYANSPATLPVFGRYAPDNYADWYRVYPGESSPTKIGPTLPLSEIGYAEGGFVEPAQEYSWGGQVRRWLKTLADIQAQPLGVAVPGSNIDKVVEDGRFKSLFETGTSGGSTSTSVRASTERKMFGTPYDIDPAKRPIYGHVFNPDMPRNSAGVYGDWIAALDPSVKNRTSVTWGDSLGADVDRGVGPFRYTDSPRDVLESLFEPGWVNSIHAGSWGRPPAELPRSFFDYNKTSEWPGYLEAQIHGGLPFDDVQAMVSTIGYSPLHLPKMSDLTGKPSYAREGYSGSGPWFRSIPGSSGVEEIGPQFPLSEIGYEEGGSVASPEEMALYGSQYYAEGGPVELAGGGAVRNWLRRLSDPIKAWHGTPHEVDKFDASKIGTGEGAQIYGHGLYFAENPDVAKWYRDTLSKDPIQTVHDIMRWFKDDPAMTYDRYSGDRLNQLLKSTAGINKFADDEVVLSNLREMIKDMPNVIRATGGAGAYSPMSAPSMRAMQQLRKHFGDATPGNLYEVGIHEDPAKFLSLDLPFMAQGQTGNRALDLLNSSDLTGARKFDRPKDFYQTTSSAFARQALDEADIPGIRYLDGMSRGKDAGTHNYVVFPGADDLIEIQGRYAEGGEVASPEEMALYGSQYYQTGGAVKRSANALIDWLSGAVAKSSPEEASARWGRRAAPPTLPESPDIPLEMWPSLSSYVDEGYRPMNRVMRKLTPEHEYDDILNGRLFGTIAGASSRRETAELWKHLNERRYEALPADIFRGGTLNWSDELPLGHQGVFHGKGFGSFSYDSDLANDFMYGARVRNPADVPFLARVPKGSHVQGQDIRRVNPSEQEYLFAPQQGFRATDVYAPSGMDSVLLDIEPYNLYDEMTPRLYAEGGQVDGYQTGGAVKRSANALIDYLTGITGGQRKAAEYAQWHGKPTKEIQHDVADFKLVGMAPEFYDNLPPVAAFPKDPAIRFAADYYTGAGYRQYNGALRNRAPGDSYDDIIKDANEHYLSFADLDSRRDMATLGRFLESRPPEPLPADIFRGGHMFVDGLPDYEPGLLRGSGFGSFSYDPRKARGFINPLESADFSQILDSTSGKLPFVARLPKGAEVRGHDLREINKYEAEHLLAPQQGFKATDVYVPLGGDHVLMDIAPHPTYDVFAPEIYAEGGQVDGYAEGGVLHNILGTVGGVLGNLIPIPGLGPAIGRFAGHTLGNVFEGNTGNIDDDLKGDFVPPHLRGLFGG